MDHHDDEAFALAWASRARALLGSGPIAELPRGVPGDEYLHPLARALGGAAAMGDQGVSLLRRGVELALPPTVAQFGHP